ncbi:MAG: aspartate kinase [Candidatus Margulisbacteria bacterium]|nr:aspartate kinase [Candidatus Margulisiibacteriota bacterium]
MLKVYKFGGTSVGTVEKIQAIADRILSEPSHQHVVVVSAMGHTTDQLVELSGSISASPDPREYDALISTGENVSAALLSMSIIAKGKSAISLNGSQAGIYTSNGHKRAKIMHVNPSRIQDELNQNKVVVVTGFQGISETNDVTTIGRGGSDTSAVVLAAALGIKECDIYTDVDGVYTTDPRAVSSAKKLTEVSYDEMLELASMGAQVLHPRAVECAKENGIILHVRSSFLPDEGTRIKESSTMELNRSVTGIALKKDESKISLVGIPNSPGIAGQLFSTLGEQGVNIDMIIQSNEQINETNTITFTVSEDDFSSAKTITESVASQFPGATVVGDTDIAKISVVGVGMISKPGVAAKMFQTLGNSNVNIQLITTSEIKISCAIASSDAQHALQALHQAFDLHLA